MEQRTMESMHYGEDAADEQPQTNIFGDAFEVVDISPVDGFRRDTDTASVRSFTPSASYSFASSPRVQTVSAHYATDAHMSIAPERQTSVRKSYSQQQQQQQQQPQNPFDDADDLYDDVETPLARSPSVQSHNFAPGIARRSISSASSRQFAMTEASRSGASGPSHPYTMYPQGTIARTVSAATSAAAARTRGSLSSRAGPTHPYGMYTQGIAQSDDEDEGLEDVTNPVPVGFGLGQTYRRVRGPEGEEQDIIGEYGHAEQLPPYTRYAEGESTKAPLLAEPEPLHTRSPVEGTDPGMPLMHQRMSQRQSMTDVSQLEQNVPLLTHSASSTEASTVGKKSWKEKTWQEKKQTRICGIRLSFWLVLLAFTVVILVALVGSTVGYFAGRHSGGTSSTESTSSLYDASLIPTPTMSMPSGSYSLSLGTAEATQASCLVNPAQRAAWDCRLAGKPAVAISVGLPPRPTPSVGAFLFYLSSDTNVTYGAQYNSLSTDYASFVPVQDNDNSTLGPAFYFQQTYDKVVIVPESALSTQPSKRWWRDPQKNNAPVQWNDDWLTRKQQAKPGERPWLCIFNDTLLEGFIYISRPAALSTATSAPASRSTSYSMTSNTATTTASIGYVSATTTAQISEQGSPTSVPAWVSSSIGDRAQHTPALAARDHSVSFSDESAFGQLQGFPYLLKLEERRMPNPPVQPYCQQFQILNDQRMNWIPDASGHPIKIMLDERNPDYVPWQNAGKPTGVSRRSAPSGECHCEWFHGSPSPAA